MPKSADEQYKNVKSCGKVHIQCKQLKEIRMQPTTIVVDRSKYLMSPSIFAFYFSSSSFISSSDLESIGSLPSFLHKFGRNALLGFSLVCNLIGCIHFYLA